MHRRCTRILSIWEDHHVVSMASKALLGQRRCGHLRRLSPDRVERKRLCASPAAVTL
ncbi:unnamed protein product [Spirodela intermedia]|uniref:Uncharacterized protein n=1 Tax=Spirodela intermedia TaxID=51605 RepID=A0A7I8KDV3_SPIIN|nr:unnamed protein product [Spirodela intermedia]